MKIERFNENKRKESFYFLTYGDYLESIKPDLKKYTYLYQFRYPDKAYWIYDYLNIREIYYSFYFNIGNTDFPYGESLELDKFYKFLNDLKIYNISKGKEYIYNVMLYEDGTQYALDKAMVVKFKVSWKDIEYINTLKKYNL